MLIITSHLISCLCRYQVWKWECDICIV